MHIFQHLACITQEKYFQTTGINVNFSIVWQLCLHISSVVLQLQHCSPVLLLLGALSCSI